MRVALLDEVHGRKIWLRENLCIPERVILLPLLHIPGATHHGLENQFATHLLNQFVEGVKWVAQVVEHAHEQDVIKLTGNLVRLVHRTLLEFNLSVERLGGELRLL